MSGEFFQVTDIDDVLSLNSRFTPLSGEPVPLDQALGRVLGEDLTAAYDIPGFDRATMDGYAVAAASTFGASEANPAYLAVVGSVSMGQTPDFTVGPGQAARIATGGMLPQGADGVVMIEHTETIDEDTIEVYHSVSPLQNVVGRDEDAASGQVLLRGGTRLRAQELGVLAACGRSEVVVVRRPRVGVISSGDEVVPIEAPFGPGQIRDVNSHTLAALVTEAGGLPKCYGIVPDRFDDLLRTCRRAIAECDMVLVSGGSSVGTRDLTVEVLQALENSRILVHGVSIRPGKPTILAQCGAKPFWGLPGHVTSAMVVFMVLVRPMMDRIGGATRIDAVTVPAQLTRNLASVQGRVDFVRVRLTRKEDTYWAEPILGASGLIRTMVEADGLVVIALNSEGLDQGSWVDVRLM
jgi:molybdopterin molybdotransferase